MDPNARKHLDHLRSEDRQLQNEAFAFFLNETETPVDWAYDAWDQLVEGLRHKDNHVGANMRKTVKEALVKWFKDCTTKKNWTLIRYDIIQDLRKLYDEVKDEKIKQKALELIETEEDPKYKKKYVSVWR